MRFNDCDPFGHLNNSKYIDYFLNAREDHLKEFYAIDLKEWALQGHTFVVSRHEIQYIRPVSYNDQVCIQTALIGIGETSLQVEMWMLDKEGQNTKCILWSSFTRIDSRTGKKTAHPEEFLQLFQQLMATDIDYAGGLNARIATLKESRPISS